MSKLVKNRGIHQEEKWHERLNLRCETFRHTSFRAKTQKDSSPMHHNFFSDVLLRLEEARMRTSVCKKCRKKKALALQCKKILEKKIIKKR